MPDDLQYVKLPDGSYGAFPSSMKDEEITAVIQKQFPPPKQPSAADRFGMETARGMGLDPEKISSAYSEGPLGTKGTKGQLLEIGKEAATGAGNWLLNVAHDPVHLLDPLHAAASGITTAAGLPDIGSALDRNAYHAPNPGRLLGATATVLGSAEGAPEVARTAGVAKNAIRVGREAYQAEKLARENAPGGLSSIGPPSIRPLPQDARPLRPIR